MNIAIYSRKSKYSEKGESIDNQIQYCKSYAEMHLSNIPDKQYIIYEDEGFSAATSVRPQFQKLLSDIRNQKIQLLMCYRLDRITRKVADFSSTLELLEQMGVGFISATENFDTSTPIGKAMIYIASVFAQLERETTAERVRDNMLALSRTGRWLGGLTPLGYSSKELIYLDEEFRERKLYQLIPKEKELETVTLLFHKYLEFKSLSGVENYCLLNGIKSRKGKYFNKSSLAQILANPTYCIGDIDSFNYFSSLGCSITCSKDSFDGTKGILCYNRTSQQTKSLRKKRPFDEWIIALGKHKGIISGAVYTEVQQYLKKNREKASPRKDTSAYALVSGKIRCGQCGSRLRIKNVRKGNGIVYYSYSCETKILSKQKQCTSANINGRLFDGRLMEILTDYLLQNADYGKILYYFKQKYASVKSEITCNTLTLEALSADREECLSEIQTIVRRLSSGESRVLEKYLLPRLNELDLKLDMLNQKIKAVTLPSEKESSVFPDMDLRSMLISADIEAQKLIVQSMVSDILWDGRIAYITLKGPEFQHFGIDR